MAAQIFDITPKFKMVPSVASWKQSVMSSLVSEQDALHIESLRDLEREYKVKIRLDSGNLN